MGDGLHTFQVRAVNSYGSKDPTPASYSWTVDTVKPGIVIGAPSTSLTGGGSVTYPVTVTEVNFKAVSFVASDFTLVKTGTANGTISLSGSGSSWVITITGITGEGTLGITLKSGSVADLAGNTNATAVVGATFVVDTVPPVVKIGALSPSISFLMPVPTVEFIVTVSDKNLGGATLAASDVGIVSSNGITATKTVTQIDATQFRVTLSNFSKAGVIRVSVLAGAFTDLANNSSEAVLSGTSARVTS